MKYKQAKIASKNIKQREIILSNQGSKEALLNNMKRSNSVKKKEPAVEHSAVTKVAIHNI